MELLKTFFVLTMMGAQLLSPSKETKKQPIHSTQSGQLAASSSSVNSDREKWKQEIKRLLGCDYDTTCREFCAKAENKEKCTYVFNKIRPSITPANSRTSSSSKMGYIAKPSVTPYPMRKAEPTKKPYPTSIMRTENMHELTASEASQIQSDIVNALKIVRDGKPAQQEALLKYLQEKYLKGLGSSGQESVKTTTDEAALAMKHRYEEEVKKREEFKARLNEVKNQKKKEIMQTMDAKITNINKKAIETLSAALDKLVSLLKTLDATILTFSADTPGLAGIMTDSLNAQTAIAEAQKAVLNQASQTYVLPVASDETKLKEQVAPVVTKLNADIKAVHETVIKAKEAVVKMYRDIAEIKAHYILTGTPAPGGVNGSSPSAH